VSYTCHHLHSDGAPCRIYWPSNAVTSQDVHPKPEKLSLILFTLTASGKVTFCPDPRAYGNRQQKPTLHYCLTKSYIKEKHRRPCWCPVRPLQNPSPACPIQPSHCVLCYYAFTPETSQDCLWALEPVLES
jgi:hypothetical protein